MRLDKYLHDLGYGSRRDIEQLLRRQVVTVDDARVKKGSVQVSADSVVAIDGEPLVYAPTVWLMLNKPAGVITATQDAHQETVMDLVPERFMHMRVAPVGRLDKDTTGLLLLTNDGALAHRLLSPKRHVEKVYEVTYEETLVDDAAERCAAGIDLGDFTSAPAELELFAPGRCRLHLREGKFHQVKRMLHELGGVVTALHRVQFGGLTLDEQLAPGDWRLLEVDEVALLEQQGLQKEGE